MSRLLPKASIRLASRIEVAEISASEISWEVVGQKTSGVASLPTAWTLPFFGVSTELHRQYAAQPKQRKRLLATWSGSILSAAQIVGIQVNDDILVRSSGSSESMAERGSLYSAVGVMHSVEVALRNCLDKLITDSDSAGNKIALLIQKRCAPLKAKGHLSNERRCYEERRDWLGEFEAADAGASSQFQINLRHWRSELHPNPEKPLVCSLSTHVSEVLRIPAEWAFQKRARVHFEWVWDGNAAYIVQADEEVASDGHDPRKEHRARSYTAIDLEPRALRPVTAADAKRFQKIENVFIYLQLGLPIAPLYILDNQRTIRDLSVGKVSRALRADLSQLVKGSLVIRTDIATSKLELRQMLPRTQEIRDASEATKWLITVSKQISKLRCDSAFIFHNFIPALSAAFAYADPKSPFVQIESLWGLPEGLYYNSHDQHMVDTLKADVAQLPKGGAISRFPVRTKTNYKPFFVSTTESGRWETLAVRAPFDWKQALSRQECQRIAYDSRRIATAKGEAVSIMWFIGVPESMAGSSLIPWYHEAYDLTGRQPTLTTRTKTMFDRSFVVRSMADVEQLRALQVVTSNNRIRIQPSEDRLIRDKNLLRDIGKIAKAKDAIIVLEGGILSHAYYQLRGTGAIVEVVHPFVGFEERHDYNKLVRDNVPTIISERGERVTTARLNREAFLRALRQKLVEEAYEVLDAKDLESVTGELADVQEVIAALIRQLSTTASAIRQQQTRKREELGGFQHGIVLIETQSLPLTAEKPFEEPRLEGFQTLGDAMSKVIDEAEFRSRSGMVERRSDRRVGGGSLELKVSLSVPVTRQKWAATAGEAHIPAAKGATIDGQISGARHGGEWHFELSVRVIEGQPELL